MNRFAELLDRLAYEPGRNNKLRLLTNYFRVVEDPDRGYALAAITGALSFKHAKAGLIRDLITERTDPTLFGLSYDYVGDLSETVALMWPKASADQHNNPPPPTLTEVVTTLRTLGKTEIPKQLSRWLDDLDETGRWALLKLVTGAMRIGISARLAKTAAAALGGKDAHEVELIWPGLTPPYLDLFAWLEGRGERPVNLDPAPFRPVMLAHALEEADFANLNPADYIAEWKWDGIRVQAVSGRDPEGHITSRLYSRSGEDITKSFPDLLPSLHLQDSLDSKPDDSRKPLHTFRHQASFAIDGELLVVREGRVQSFNVLQQRLNRKVVSPKLIKEFPIHLRAYDLLADDETDLRDIPFVERRERLTAFVARLGDPKVDLSPTIAFDSWETLAAARRDPSSAGAGEDAEAVEGVMLKRRDALYLPGRPKGQWWKWTAGIGQVVARAVPPADGNAWLEALAGIDLVVRAGFDDDAMLGAAKRLDLRVIVARAMPAQIDVISFPRRAPAPEASLEVPPQAATSSAPGAADVVAGTLAAAEALVRLAHVDGPVDQGHLDGRRIRHLRLPLDGGTPLAQELGAS